MNIRSFISDDIKIDVGIIVIIAIDIMIIMLLKYYWQ